MGDEEEGAAHYDSVKQALLKLDDAMRSSRADLSHRARLLKAAVKWSVAKVREQLAGTLPLLKIPLSYHARRGLCGGLGVVRLHDGVMRRRGAAPYWVSNHLMW